MNGEIGPVAGQNYEIWNCSIFVMWIFKGKSKLCIITKHSSLIINLHKQQAYKFVQFSDLIAKNWQICTPTNVNISVPTPQSEKLLIYKESP